MAISVAAARSEMWREGVKRLTGIHGGRRQRRKWREACGVRGRKSRVPRRRIGNAAFPGVNARWGWLSGLGWKGSGVNVGRSRCDGRGGLPPLTPDPVWLWLLAADGVFERIQAGRSA